MAEFISASAAFSFIVRAVYRKADAYVTRNIGTESELNGAVKKLRASLGTISGMLSDAERKMIQDNNSGLRSWLVNLKDAAHDAEDVLDELEHEALKQEIEDKENWGISRYIRKLDFIKWSTHDFTGRVREIHGRLEHILHLATYFKLEMLSSEKLQGWRETTSAIVEPVMDFRKEQKSCVIKKLVSWQGLSDSSSSSAFVLSICGMGGIGKTTLAKDIYNDDTVKQKFSFKVWVHVSPEFNVISIMNKILDSWYNHKSKSSMVENESEERRHTFLTINTNSLSLESLQSQVRNVLEGKRFLIILDDVWNGSPQRWDDFKGSLPRKNCKGCVVTTCREKRVAEVMSSEIEPLEALQKEHIMHLFEKTAFEGHNPDHSDTITALRALSDRIVDKLSGNPLVAVSIGRMLRSNLSKTYWEEVLENKSWQESSNQKENDIIPSLLLCYLYLPEYLKPCFAYCSLFPRDKVLKEVAIHTWIAQGYIPQKYHGESEYNIGRRYLNELIDRSLLENDSITGDARYFRMHDLKFDLAAHVSKGDVYQLKGEISVQEIPDTVRHLNITIDEHFNWDNLKSLQNLKYLRSLYFGNEIPTTRSAQEAWNVFLEKHLQEAKYLRVLAFPETKRIPDTIGTLKLLRYLYVPVMLSRKLPRSIKNLINLQCLQIRFVFEQKELPEGTKNLRNLRCLGFRYSLMPPKISGLPQLDKLETVRFKLDGSNKLIDLQPFHRVEQLTIEGLENIKTMTEAKESALDTKPNLKQLVLAWSSSKHSSLPYYQDVLDGLQPSTQIKTLVISCYDGSRFPSWMMNNYLSNLQIIRLLQCNYLEDIPSVALSCNNLRKLVFRDCPNLPARPSTATCFPPSLVQLTVVRCGKFGNSIKRRHLEGLRSLEILQLEGCKEIEFLPTTQLTSLRQLGLVECPKLVVTKGSGLETLTLLEYLSIKNCFKLHSTVAAVGSKGLPPSLCFLKIAETVPTPFPFRSWTSLNLPSLKVLHISGKTEAVKLLSDSRLLPKSIRNIKLTDCYFLRDIDVQLLNLIERLTIFGCPQLDPPSAEGATTSNITDFAISPCGDRQLKEWLCFLKNSHLADLFITNYNEKSFGDETKRILLDIKSIKHLCISSSALRSLPAEISKLSTLTALHIQNCTSIQSLPNFPSSLVELIVAECPKLKRRLRLPCEQWKISRIPVAEIV